jgi:hypothetical protein
MADNANLYAGNLGAIIPIATKDIGGFQHQQVLTGLRQRSTLTPVISTAIYANGDCLGPIQTIVNAARLSAFGGLIQSITVVDKTQAQRAAIDLIFFDSLPTTALDNAVFTMSDADAAKVQAIVSILTTDYNTAWAGTPANSVAFKPDTKIASSPQAMAIPYLCVGSTSLFMQAVVRGTPTYTSTSDITIQVNCLLD